MRQILSSCLVISIGLVPVTMPLMVQPSWAQTQDLQAQMEELLKVNQQIQDLQAQIALFEATQQTQIGQYEQAIETLQQVLDLARKLKNRQIEALVIGGIGFNYEQLDQFQQALDYYYQALPIYQEVGDRKGEAVTLNNIGVVYHAIGQPQQALKYFNQALPIRREVGDRSGEATTFNNIGGVYNAIGQPQQALDYYKQALPISREVGNRPGEATTLNNIGLVYHTIGQPKKALEYYNQALPIHQEVGNRAGVATTFNNIGGVYNDIGQPQQAITQLKQAVTITIEMRQGLQRENRPSFLQSNRGSVIALTNLLIDENQPKQAFDWINLYSTAELADYTRLINAQVSNTQAQKSLDQWNQKNQQLEFLRQQLQANFSEERSRQFREFEAQVNQEAEDPEGVTSSSKAWQTKHFPPQASKR